MSLDMNLEPDRYLDRLKTALDAVEKDAFVRLHKMVAEMIGTEATLFVAGNGGSAATSSHMACDLGKTILGKHPLDNGRRLRVLSLNDNIPLMTAWGNDEGYEHIFAEQLASLARRGDALIVITGSGNSPNIVKLVERAKGLGVRTFGILGFDGGKVMPLCDDHLLVPSDDYGVIEDAHSVVNHLITDDLKRR